MKGSRTLLLLYLDDHPYKGNDKGGTTIWDLKMEGFNTSFSHKVLRQWLDRGIVAEHGRKKEESALLTFVESKDVPPALKGAGEWNLTEIVDRKRRPKDRKKPLEKSLSNPRKPYDLTERGRRLAQLMRVFIKNGFAGNDEWASAEMVAQAIASENLGGREVADAVACGLLAPHEEVPVLKPIEPQEFVRFVDEWKAKAQEIQKKPAATKTDPLLDALPSQATHTYRRIRGLKTWFIFWKLE